MGISLNFYSNHNIDFKRHSLLDIRFHGISALRKIPFPDSLVTVTVESYPNVFSTHTSVESTLGQEWGPVDVPGVTPHNVRNLNPRIIAFGPMVMRIILVPNHIILPSILYDREGFYSPQNKMKVHEIRKYYYRIISLYGGDRAIYVDDRVVNKFNFPADDFKSSVFKNFENELVERYGENRKHIYSYAQGKFPRYYIDTFDDLKDEVGLGTPADTGLAILSQSRIKSFPSKSKLP